MLRGAGQGMRGGGRWRVCCAGVIDRGVGGRRGRVGIAVARTGGTVGRADGGVDAADRAAYRVADWAADRI